jgi:hypothetical protein
MLSRGSTLHGKVSKENENENDGKYAIADRILPTWKVRSMNNLEMGIPRRGSWERRVSIGFPRYYFSGHVSIGFPRRVALGKTLCQLAF